MSFSIEFPACEVNMSQGIPKGLLPVKVLMPGPLDEGWCTEATCKGEGRYSPGCGKVVEVVRGNLFQRHQHDMGGQRNQACWVCPCGVVNVLYDHSPFGTLIMNGTEPELVRRR